MNGKMLEVQDVSTTKFQKYGWLIDKNYLIPQLINDGTCFKFDLNINYSPSAETANYQPKIYASKNRSFPLLISHLERHPHGIQFFFPFCGTAFISVVAPISVDIDPDSVEAFFIPKNVGIVINRDVWHHSLISINDNSQFFVIENEVPNNCKIQSISQKLVIRDYNCR